MGCEATLNGDGPVARIAASYLVSGYREFESCEKTVGASLSRELLIFTYQKWNETPVVTLNGSPG